MRKSRYGIRLAQAAWVVIFLITLALDANVLVMLVRHAGEICQGSACANYQVPEADAALIHSAGMSVQAYQMFQIGYSLLSNLIWMSMGLVLFLLKRNDPLSLFVSISLVTFGSVAFGLLGQPDFYDNNLLSTGGRMIFLLGQVGFLLFFIFPDGRFYPRWMIVPAAGWVLGLLPMLIFPQYQPVSMQLPALVLLVVLMVVSQVLRYRQMSSSIQRQQVKWVSFSIILAFVLFVIFLLVSVATAQSHNVYLSLGMNLLLYLVMAFIPISVGIAILRYRLWDIDLIIQRTVVYGLLSGFLGLLYFLGIVVSQQVFRLVTGQESAAAIVITTLGTAALFSPLRRLFQSAIDRRFDRKKYDIERTLEEFGQVLRGEVDLESISGWLLKVTDEALQPKEVHLWVKTRR